MTPLGLGLGLGFNRGGVSNESAPDIERNGLLFNLDASDISKLYRYTANQEDNPVYVQATVNNVVNRIVAMNGGGDINLETPTLNEAYVLKQDVNGKYYLSADPNNTAGIVVYTINRVAAASAQTISSTNNLVVATWGSTIDGDATMLSVTSTGSLALCKYNGYYFAGAGSTGLRYALSGLSPMQVRAINNKDGNWFAFDGLVEKINPPGDYRWRDFSVIGSPLNGYNRYNLMGIQVYSGLTNSAADKAKALEIVKKARAYYGVA